MNLPNISDFFIIMTIGCLGMSALCLVAEGSLKLFRCVKHRIRLNTYNQTVDRR
jgi:hypothetical protein